MVAKTRNKSVSLKPAIERNDEEASLVTAKGNSVESVSVKEQVVKPKAKLVQHAYTVNKDDRRYEGPASRLMNALYDNIQAERVSPITGPISFSVTDLEGWTRTSIHIAKACERMEKSGWKKK